MKKKRKLVISYPMDGRKIERERETPTMENNRCNKDANGKAIKRKYHQQLGFYRVSSASFEYKKEGA